MMNYIWAGLIVIALGFALYADGRDFATNPYCNGRELPATIKLPPPAGGTAAPAARVTVQLTPESVAAFRGSELAKAELDALEMTGELTRLDGGYELKIVSDPLIRPLSQIRAFHDESNKSLRAKVIGLPDRIETQPGAPAVAVTLRFEPVRFVKLRAITNAAFEFAKTAVTIALGFIGVFALWMGLMKIAETSGLVDIFVYLVQPFLRLLFPEVPKGHPALGMIAMNLAANMLGLGNAATPMGIKAMEELQKLNPRPDTASNPMVMLLAMNTAGVQLLPSATLVAVMGMSSLRVFLPILIVTGISLVIAIVVTRLLGRLPGYKRSDPNAAEVTA